MNNRNYVLLYNGRLNAHDKDMRSSKQIIFRNLTFLEKAKKYIFN